MHSYYEQVLKELQELRRSMRRAHRSQGAASGKRLAELEAGLGRVALLARALAELGVERGLITIEDLGRKLKQVDEADGAKDDALDPRVVLPGESKLADLEPLVKAPRAHRRTRRQRR